MSVDHYLRFASLAHEARLQAAGPALTAGEEVLLNFVAQRAEAGEVLTVLQVMEAAPGGSATTVHRRLGSLRQKGYLDLVPLAHDQRIKQVRPSQQAIRYFAQLGRCVLQAA